MNEIFINKLSFQRKPIPLPADYRPMYKIAVITLVLKYCCRGETSNLLKLHLLSWALASKQNMDKLKDYIKSDYATDFTVWGIEPALNRALLFAVAENICEIIDGKKYKLTRRGNEFFKMIDSDSDLFQLEKEFLLYVGKNNLTDNRLSSITNKWNLFYAED